MDASSLDTLRQEIDAIDGDLHGLIGRRAALVGRISAAKPAGGGGLFWPPSSGDGWKPMRVTFPPAPFSACGAK
jgi:chorismate mutase